MDWTSAQNQSVIFFRLSNCITSTKGAYRREHVKTKQQQQQKKPHYAGRDIHLDRDEFYQEGSRDRFFLSSREYMHFICLSPATLLTNPVIKHNFDGACCCFLFGFGNEILAGRMVKYVAFKTECSSSPIALPRGLAIMADNCSKPQDKVNRPFHIVVIVVQSLSRVWLFATPWTAARQASLSFTVSWSLLKLTSVESAMPSSHLILCGPLLLLTHLAIYSFPRTLRDCVSDRACRALGAHRLCFWTDQPESILSSHLLCNQSVAQSFSFLCCRIKITLLSTWVGLGQHQKRWPASRESTVPSR